MGAIGVCRQFRGARVMHGTITSVEVLRSGIRLNALVVENQEVAEFFRGLPDTQREQGVIEAIKFGVDYLQRAQTGSELDYVNRAVDGLFERIHDKFETRIVAKLDPTPNDSIQGTLGAAVENVTRENGALVNAVRATVREIFPLLFGPFQEETRKSLMDDAERVTV
jgi:hypothetical protein